nr:hypothetical protein [Tanacetum cinerariifolium]
CLSFVPVVKGNTVKVSKRCLVQFSISKSYKHETHAEGFNLFMKKTGFEELMKTISFVFTLVVVKENKIISEAPLQVQPLLKEFADEFAELQRQVTELLSVCNTRERIDNSLHCYKCGRLGHYARDYEPGDELVYPDRGEALVIQRILNVVVSKSVDDNSWLRNNIFRTKCTSKGEICDMIIDGGSCENTHAEGFNLFMKKTGFEELMKTISFVFTLVVVKENKIISEAPLQVQPLLKEFADVIPDDIPSGLLAIKDM